MPRLRGKTQYSPFLWLQGRQYWSQQRLWQRGVSQMKAESRHVQRAFCALLEIVGSKEQDWSYRSSPLCLKQHPKPDKSLTGGWWMNKRFPLCLMRPFPLNEGISRWESLHLFSVSLGCLKDLKSYFCPQVTWCPEQCITCSPSMPSTMATAPPCTTSRGRSTGSPRPCIPFAISCTARRWNGKIPTWNPPKSTSRWKGKTCVGFGWPEREAPIELTPLCGGWVLPLRWCKGGAGEGPELPSFQKLEAESCARKSIWDLGEYCLFSRV